jgi:hypothetical protein
MPELAAILGARSDSGRESGRRPDGVEILLKVDSVREEKRGRWGENLDDKALVYFLP